MPIQLVKFFADNIVMKFKKAYIALASMLSVVAIQLGFVSSAYALDSVDIIVTAKYNFGNSVIQAHICSYGTTDVKQVNLDIDLENYTVDQVITNIGSYDSNTQIWTGTLVADPDGSDEDYGTCIDLTIVGEPSGGLGSTTGGTITVLSSVLSDDSPNVDPNPEANNAVDLPDITIEEDSDLTITPRLATTGDISDSTNLTYEVTVKNVGAGNYYDNGFLLLAFVMPEGSTLSGAVDPHLDDKFALYGCQDVGPIAGVGYPQLSEYIGTAVICTFHVTGDGIIAPDASYLVNINIVAGATFASGEATVYGFVQGNERDSGQLMVTLAEGGDPFLLVDDFNSAMVLEYNPDTLRVTVNRCPGQGATTTNGTACFRVSFNKLIYAPSFAASDIDLGSNGSVTGFTQLDDYTWEVIVSGIQKNTTLTFLLSPDSVQDYSAVLNDVNVLGINTVRYEAQDAQADQELPNTGTNTDVTYLAITLIMFGFAMWIASKKNYSLAWIKNR